MTKWQVAQDVSLFEEHAPLLVTGAPLLVANSYYSSSSSSSSSSRSSSSSSSFMLPVVMPGATGSFLLRS